MEQGIRIKSSELDETVILLLLMKKSFRTPG